MYTAALFAHSWVRWAVVIAGVVVFLRAATGASARRPWTRSDDRASLWFTIALDVQVLLGLLLYVETGLPQRLAADAALVMQSPSARFWTVEPPLGMLVGPALAHVGRVMVRKADVSRRHKLAAIFFGIALIAILASLPWPGMPNGRPWLRWR